MRGLDNFDTRRTEYFRDGTVALEAFKAGQIDFREENVAKEWATAYDFPAVQKGSGEEGTAEPPSADRHAGLWHEHPPGAVQGRARPARPGAWCSISSGPMPTCSMAATPAPAAISATATWRPAASRRAPNWRCWTSIAASCRPICSPSRSSCRSPTAPATTARQLRAALALLEQAGWKVPRPQAGRRRGQAVQLRNPAGPAGVRARRAALRPVAVAAGHRGAGANRRSGAVPAADRYAMTTT